jgi:hypothetical protein
MPLSDTACRNLKAADRPLKTERRGEGSFCSSRPLAGSCGGLSYRFEGKAEDPRSWPVPSCYSRRCPPGARRGQRAAGRRDRSCPKEKTEKRARRSLPQTPFESIAREWHANRTDAWTPGTARYVLKRLETDLFPDLGSRPIAEIDAPELLEVMRKIERRGVNEMPAASRHLQPDLPLRHRDPPRCSRSLRPTSAAR